ncbi:MAG: GHMP kinase [Gammaproteobacteria bacterium]|nr:MAG: GHMP kinase [Gammaproteobacteria bacterium]
MKNKEISGAVCESISVIAPARLHLGFLDMHGGLGRQFGSLGLCLSEIYTHLTAKKSDDIVIHGPSSQRGTEYVSRIFNALKITGGVDITIHEEIPEHAGLGSGTQLSLAIGMAISRLYGSQKSVREIAALMKRGSRSGIGIGGFSMGGFLVDAGRGEATEVPPIVSHCYFPEEWRVLLVFDKNVEGINGAPEKEIFDELPPMTEEVSGRICRLVLMQVLPALAEKNCIKFGSAITEIQIMIGEHFSDAQDGHYSSQQVAEVMHWLSDRGATGIGQSSWGPTGFAIYPNELEAYSALQSVRKNWQEEKHLEFCLCTARNTMADVIIDGQLPQDTNLQSYQ